MPSMGRFMKRSAAALSLLAVLGCGTYGRLQPLTELGEKLTIRDLQANWRAHAVYYTDTGGPNYGNVALLFDPRNDDRDLVTGSWTRIEDPADLSRIIGWMEKDFRPGLYAVVASDGSRFGYLYAARQWIIAQEKGPRTMQVYDFRPRPSGP